MNMYACPSCLASLNNFECRVCGVRYLVSPDGQPDLRLRTPKTYTLDFRLGETEPKPNLDWRPLRLNPAGLDFTGVEISRHLYPEICSYIPAAAPRALALDLGCGRGMPQRPVVEHAGYSYVGLDYSAPDATLLGDAHSLPFPDETFDLVISVTVFEHLRYPHVAAREVRRVLKPGGTFMGTVAFLEPFHGESFFHHTHLGVYTLLRSAGLAVEQVSPHPDYPVLLAQAQMGGLFPGLPRPYARALVLPVIYAQKLLWRGAKAVKNADDTNFLRNSAGGFAFVARREIARDAEREVKRDEERPPVDAER